MKHIFHPPLKQNCSKRQTKNIVSTLSARGSRRSHCLKPRKIKYTERKRNPSFLPIEADPLTVVELAASTNWRRLLLTVIGQEEKRSVAGRRWRGKKMKRVTGRDDDRGIDVNQERSKREKTKREREMRRGAIRSIWLCLGEIKSSLRTCSPRHVVVSARARADVRGRLKLDLDHCRL